MDDRSGSMFGLGFILTGILGTLLFIGYLMTAYQIEEYERGILTRFGRVVEISKPGLHFRMPFVTGLTEVRVDAREITNPKHPANTYTVDNQEVNVVYKAIYKLPGDDENLTWIWVNVSDYAFQLDSFIVDRMKRELGKVNIDRLAQERDAVAKNILTVLKRDIMDVYRITIIDFQLPNIDYTHSYKAAIEKSAEAKAGIETEKQKLEQAKKQAETVETRAAGEAKAYKLKTDAEAEGYKAIGLAKAAALKAEGEALSANQQLVQYELAKRWVGNYPTYVGGGMPLPFTNVPIMLDTPATKR